MLCKLQALGLQRCFQLDSNALSQILGATSAADSKLEVVTLSHLSLQDWPSSQADVPALNPTSEASRWAQADLFPLFKRMPGKKHGCCTPNVVLFSNSCLISGSSCHTGMEFYSHVSQDPKCVFKARGSSCALFNTCLAGE